MSTITLGLDLGDRASRYAVLDADAHLVGEGSVATTREAMQDFVAALPTARVILEVGTHSPWVSRIVATGGHEVIVANPRRVRLISAAVRKNDRIDAVTLARLGRADPALLSPIHHRGETAQADRGPLRARDALVRTRTLLINHVQGTVKAMGYRVPSSTARTFALRARTALPPALAPALASVVETIAHLTEQIAAADKVIGLLARERYPETMRLRQIAGVGPITALCFVLTLDDPTRFAGSRSVGAYLGLCPRESQSGARAPQLRISKAGDPMLRRLLVTSAHYVLGPFGPDTDLRRWGWRSRREAAPMRRSVRSWQSPGNWRPCCITSGSPTSSISRCGRWPRRRKRPSALARHELNRPVRGLRLLLLIFEIARQRGSPTPVDLSMHLECGWKQVGEHGVAATSAD